MTGPSENGAGREDSQTEPNFSAELAEPETKEEADFEALQLKMQELELSPDDVINFLKEMQNPNLTEGVAIAALNGIRLQIRAAILAKQDALGEGVLDKFDQLKTDVLASPVLFYNFQLGLNTTSEIPRIVTSLTQKDLISLFGVSLLSVEREGDVAPKKPSPEESDTEDYCVLHEIPDEKIAYLTTSDGHELRVTCSPSKYRTFTIKLSSEQNHLF